MGLAPGDAFSALPSTLRDDLLTAFNDIVKNYREHRWEPAELNGGKLCEAVFTVVEGWMEGGIYPARAKKPSRFPQTCWALEQKYAQVPNSRSPRILIPRMMIGLYDIRNNRGVGHERCAQTQRQREDVSVSHTWCSSRAIISVKPTRMLLIGLTGGIASGKSTVSGFFRALGATVIDADVIAREVVARGTEGTWDEPPKFPGLTNAYYQALETAMDTVKKPFAKR